MSDDEKSSDDKKQRVQLSKTEMCRFFLKGLCQRGRKCTFAHSQDEIREKPDLACTSLCLRFKNKGSCNIPACNFAHGVSELRITERFKTKMCEFNRLGQCKAGAECRFAHDKKDLVEDHQQLSDDEDRSSRRIEEDRGRRKRRQRSRSRSPRRSSNGGSEREGGRYGQHGPPPASAYGHHGALMPLAYPPMYPQMPPQGFYDPYGRPVAAGAPYGPYSPYGMPPPPGGPHYHYGPPPATWGYPQPAAYPPVGCAWGAPPDSRSYPPAGWHQPAPAAVRDGAAPAGNPTPAALPVAPFDVKS